MCHIAQVHEGAQSKSSPMAVRGNMSQCLLHTLYHVLTDFTMRPLVGDSRNCGGNNATAHCRPVRVGAVDA